MKAKALLLIVFFAASAHAETRRALLVGIDHYIRPGKSDTPALSAKTKERLAKVQGRPSRTQISDLEGAVNDAVQLRDLLIRKYKFDPKNIVLLKDGEATADRILDTLQTHLVTEAKPGDVSFFYYAGHGSRIKNTLTKNLSGMDSTIVPADTLLGVPDIRSKELDRIYLQARAPGKDVQLTVVQDSCFSGAGTRGVRPAHRTRAVDSDDKVSVAEALDGPLPEERGVLFFSASQDYQPAQEVDGDRMGTHGAFTWAFLQVLATAGDNERADRIFQRTRALMQSKVNDQEPVALESGGRNARALFGNDADPFGAASAAVGFVKPESGMVELNSGVTMGLAAGSELKRISPAGNPPVRIRITEVNGPSSANAAPIAPSQISAIAAGDLFQLDKLVVPDKEFLKVYVGDAAPFAQLAPVVRLVADLRAGKRIELIEDPTENTPTHVLFWDGEKKRWTLSENRLGGELSMTAEVPSADEVVKALAGQTSKARLAVIPPVPQELLSSLSFSSKGNIVSFAKSLQSADYFLAGRVNAGGGVEYAWARPWVTQEDMRNQYEAARREKRPLLLSGWPLRSEWLAVNEAGLAASGGALTQKGLDLARIAGWLQLQTPVPDDAFPYGIGLRDEKTRELSEGELTGKRTYKIVLRRDPLSPQTPVTPRRVYSFVVDRFGTGTLVFPAGNLDNEFPQKDLTTLPDEIDLNAKVQITPPYGIDNYFLMTSVQPIDNPEAVFNFDGVRTRGFGARGPLEKLLSGHAAGTRGALSGVPTNWSIERIPFRSKDPNQ